MEEIDDMKILYDEKISHLELQSHRCEDVVRSVEKKIEDLGDALAGFEKEMKEMKDLGDASITLNLPLMFRHFLPFSRGLINRLLPLLWILFCDLSQQVLVGSENQEFPSKTSFLRLE